VRLVTATGRPPESAVVAACATLSRHGAAVYETLLYADGRLSCDCPAWIFVKKGRPRGCRHTRAVESQVAGLLAGRVAVAGGRTGGPSGPTPRGPTATSPLTGRPLRRFDLS
jgi:hypothetical protein